MTPREPIHDVMYGLVTDAKAPGYGSLAFTIGGSHSNLADDFGCEFLGVSVLFDRMRNVLLVRHPLKIAGSVIRSVKVFVVDAWETIWIWDESNCDKAGNVRHSLLSFFAKNYVSVATFIRSTRKNLASTLCSERRRFVGTESVKATYFSKIRDFVETFVVSDWQPSFADHSSLHHRRHLTTWRDMVQG